MKTIPPHNTTTYAPVMSRYHGVGEIQISETPMIYSNPLSAYAAADLDCPEPEFYPARTYERDTVFPSIYSDPILLWG